MELTNLILVGGFLGAGKTTLMREVCRKLAEKGKKVGLITNDQATDLVDSQILRGCGYQVKEIAGGCFCCKFGDFAQAADDFLASLNPDFLLAEPVGSCTDLSATVIQPLKELRGDKLRVSPFAVLVDPARLLEALDPSPRRGLHGSARYIIRKQLEEADLIVLSKSDLLSPNEVSELKKVLAERFPRTPHLLLSSVTGQGIDELLVELLSPRIGGSRIAEVDYDVYAEGEAILGWLNASVSVGNCDVSTGKRFLDAFLKRIYAELKTRSREVAHIKVSLEISGSRFAGHITDSRGAPVIREIEPGTTPSGEHGMTINARVQASADELREIILQGLKVAAPEGVDFNVRALQVFSPSRPNPTHRYKTVF